MSHKTIAVVVLRCLGIFSILSGLFHILSYLPITWDPARHGAGPSAGVLLSLFSSILVGVILLLFARPLANLVVRGDE